MIQAETLYRKAFQPFLLVAPLTDLLTAHPKQGYMHVTYHNVFRLILNAYDFC